METPDDNELTAFSIFEAFSKQEAALLTGAVLALGLAGPVLAEGPAVDGVNGKLEAHAGSVGGDGAGLLGGSVTAPLGQAVGVQLDGMAGKVDGHGADGLALHLFQRDPDSHLVGLSAATLNYRGQDVERVGIEGELYRNQWTIGANLGQQSGDLGDDAYYGLGATYYSNPDLALKAGIDGHGDNQQVNLGAEWQTGSNWSMSLEGGAGDGDNYLLAGVRLYLGKQKTLIDRHRRDDPDNPLLNAVNLLKDEMDSQAANGSGGGGGDGGGE